MAGNSRFSTAIHIMTSLGFAKGQPMTSEQLSKSIGINAVCVRRVLSHLSKAGLIDCQGGKSGGCRLLRDPSQISLAEIYRALGEEPLFSVPEKVSLKACPVSCRMRGLLAQVFGKAQYSVESTFDQVVLSQLLKEIPGW